MNRFLATLLVFLGLAVPANAASLNEEDQATVARIHGYLTGLTTMSSNFLQVSSTGAVAQGQVYLQRPGKLRFEYAPPSPILMVADGFWLFYQDNELEQTSQFPISRTPLAVLVSDVENLQDLIIVDAIERKGGLIRLAARQKSDPDMGQVILTFTDRPFQLRQWTIVDAQGTEVKVSLLDPVFGRKLDPELFQFVPPTVEDNSNR